jgi:hypothetical protein
MTDTTQLTSGVDFVAVSTHDLPKAATPACATWRFSKTWTGNR